MVSFCLLFPLQCAWFINLGDNESSAPVGCDKFMARMLMAQIEVRGGAAWIICWKGSRTQFMWFTMKEVVLLICSVLVRWVKWLLSKQNCKRWSGPIVQAKIVLTFLCGLILAVFKGAGSPCAPGGHLTLYRAGNMAELGGVRRNTQTQVIVHWPRGWRDTKTHIVTEPL